MKIRLPRLRRRHQPDEEQNQVGNVEFQKATRTWLTPGARTGIVVAMLCCGPMALGYLVATGRSPTAKATAATSAPVPTSDGAVAYASSFLSVWLSAGKGSEDSVRAYYPAIPSLPYPANTWLVSQAKVTSAVQGKNHVWGITLQAGVQLWDGQKYVPTGQHCYAVPVQEITAAAQAPGAYAIVALPAEVACSIHGEPPNAQYNTTVSSTTGPVADTTTAFLKALLTGAADLDRYITPGVQILPITPAPYSSIKIQSIAVGNTPQPPENLTKAPADGAVITVLVAADASIGAQTALPLSYSLQLTARGGRWEASALLGAPEVAEPAAPSASPSPSSSASSPPASSSSAPAAPPS